MSLLLILSGLFNLIESTVEHPESKKKNKNKKFHINNILMSVRFILLLIIIFRILDNDWVIQVIKTNLHIDWPVIH